MKFWNKFSLEKKKRRSPTFVHSTHKLHEEDDRFNELCDEDKIGILYARGPTPATCVKPRDTIWFYVYENVYFHQGGANSLCETDVDVNLLMLAYLNRELRFLLRTT